MKQQLTKQGLLDCLEQLNRHYNLRVQFKTGHPNDGANCPCVEPMKRLIIVPRIALLYNKYVMAHEYAHITHLPVGTPSIKWLKKLKRMSHNNVFEHFYQEACLVLNIPYLPTKRLTKALSAERLRRGIPKYHRPKRRWDMYSGNRKKLLYLDVDGVLLGKKEPSDTQVVLARFARDFIDYCVHHFDCYWLSTHCPDGDATPVVTLLSRYADEMTMTLIETIRATSWRKIKIEAIDLKSDFYWIEDQPTSYELEILKKNNALHRLLPVDTRKDPDYLKRAIDFLEEVRIQPWSRSCHHHNI